MDAPKIPSIVKLPRNKKFRYYHRFYNRRKEYLAERERNIRNELNAQEGDSGQAHISFNKNRSMFRKRSIQRSNIRIILITLILAALAYYFLIN